MKYVIKAYEPKEFIADNDEEMQMIVKSLIRQGYKMLMVESHEGQ